MPTLTFEDMTQAQADAFRPGDMLHFRSTAVQEVRAEWVGGPTHDVPVLMLTVGDRTLSFPADALDDGAAITFASEGDHHFSMTFREQDEHFVIFFLFFL